MELETFCVLLGDRCVALDAIARRWYNASGICNIIVLAIFFAKIDDHPKISTEPLSCIQANKNLRSK